MKKWSIIQCFCMAAIPFVVVADPSQEELKQGLMDANPALAGEAVGACAAKGEAFLPILRKWASSDDPRLRLRARECHWKGNWAVGALRRTLSGGSHSRMLLVRRRKL